MPDPRVLQREVGAGLTLRIELLNDHIARIRLRADAPFTDSALNRYGFISPPSAPDIAPDVQDSQGQLVVRTGAMQLCCANDGQIRILNRNGDQVLHQQSARIAKRGAVVRFLPTDDEDWIGFGDQARDRLFHRGHVADCHVRNVESYIPVPFFMSTRGVGVLVNTTHRVVFDMCCSDPKCVEWRDGRAAVDYYVFVGSSFRELLDAYTWLTGRPKLPPVWAFGLWYICRTQANDVEAVNDALNFRREQIPCDVVGLEPGWMEQNYDGSLQKAWSRERFPIPSYCQNGPHNFFNALKRMGFRLELWLCCDYDLFYEAERRVGKRTEPNADGEEDAWFFQPDAEMDEHFSRPRRLDTITRTEEPWFEHLKKFVDQGVDFFKQDGAYQVLDHPDRRWGGIMDDAEGHNIYPLLYARQMLEGFEAHTGRRGLTFTPCGWTGCQAWAGTWTGDTGGRLPTLGAMLNTAIIGHSWATNDMEVAEKGGIHFGYLLPWSQINSWNYFRMPWVQGRQLADMHKFYSRLRSRLVPYIYTWAYHATRTGYPLMTPLALEFEQDPNCRQITHQFLLGRDLLVTIYERDIYLPQGCWKDYWTGETLEGGRFTTIDWPEDRGGGLFVRAGAIIPFGPVLQYRGEGPVDDVELYVFATEQETRFELYEDDGVSLEHRHGERATTAVTAQRRGPEITVSVAATDGTFEGQTDRRRWAFRIAVDSTPAEVAVNGTPLMDGDWRLDAERGEIVIPAQEGPADVRVTC